MREKYYGEIGFAFFEDNIHFIYYVGADCIVIYVLQGTVKATARNLVMDGDYVKASSFMANDYGCVVIPYADIPISYTCNTTDIADPKAQEIRLEAMQRCVKSFLFMKTAKVITETFIPDGNIRTRLLKNNNSQQDGVVRVDTFWDKDIDVIAPFSVRGHFRKQPKKNEKGDWVREVIYIDSFMKQGYHRKATKEQLEK